MIKWTVIFVVVIFVRLWIFFFNKKKIFRILTTAANLLLKQVAGGNYWDSSGTHKGREKFGAAGAAANMIYSQNKTGSKCNTQYTLLSLCMWSYINAIFLWNFQSSQIYINIPSTHHIKRDRENETGQNKVLWKRTFSLAVVSSC